METTINKIKALNPCKEGLVRLLEQLGNKFDMDKEFEVADLVKHKGDEGYAIWLMGENRNKKELVEFAVYCAELVLPIFEKESSNKAPRESIELTRKWLANPESVSSHELKSTASTANATSVAGFHVSLASHYAANTASASIPAAMTNAAVNAAYAALGHTTNADLTDKITKKLIKILRKIK